MPVSKAQRMLDDIIASLKSRDFKYEAKEEKEINWAAYNLSKIHEIDLFLTFVREAVDSACQRVLQGRGPGRPPCDASDLAKIVLMKEFFQVGERQAEGLGMLFREKLSLKNSVSASSIGRAYSNPDVQVILLQVFEMTSKPISDKETSFSADGTGLPLSIKQNYANDRDNQEKHAGYDKMAVMVSNNFHIATGFAHAEGTANDAPLLIPVLKQTAKNFTNINDVELDAGFLSRTNCNAINSFGAKSYIYPKEDITINKKGSTEWVTMLTALIEDPQEWLRQYHNRSQSETYNSSHKRRFTKPLLRKIKTRRGTEALCRVIGTNICMLITAHFEKRAKVKEFTSTYF